MLKKLTLSVLLLLLHHALTAQNLKPGFDTTEYISLMKVSAQFGDSGYAARLPPPQGYRLLYRSPVVGLDNRWDLWQTDNGKGVVSIRGTTRKEVSWLANFYAAMVPAKGELQLSKTERFVYHLSDNLRAAVHVGWLVATGFLANDIVSRIDSLHKSGTTEFYIMGHSQGGAIAYLLTAYLLHLQKKNILSPGLRFKTYCSAAPKPGNLYFAYEYEFLTQGGWAYNVVNAADWVPQTPVSIQTLTDLNEVNPFANAKTFIKQQGWPKRWAFALAYARLTKPGQKAQQRYQRYLGNFVAKAIKKHLPGFTEPDYFGSNDYARTGNTIVLKPTVDYYELYPQDQQKIFVHHYHAPYIYLTRRLAIRSR